MRRDRLKGCLRDNAKQAPPVAIGVDGKRTHGLGLRSVRGDDGLGEVRREEIH